MGEAPLQRDLMQTQVQFETPFCAIFRLEFTLVASILRHSTQGDTTDFPPDSANLSVTASVEPPLYPYGIAYRRGYGLSNFVLFTKCLCVDCQS